MNDCDRPDLRDLLPWRVNDTLDARERAELDRHLSDCAACRDELRRCEQLGVALKSAAGAAPAPHPARLESLLSRLDAGEPPVDGERSPSRSPSVAGRLRALGRATPRPVRWLLAAQLAGLAVLLTAASAPPRTIGFRTLATPEVAPATPALRIVFAPDCSEAEMRRLLLEVRAEIVAGPSPLGAYTLALGPLAAGESPEAVVELLRGRAAVRFVEPIGGSGPVHGDDR